MANNLDITTNDFENICRTCFSREDLNPLYVKDLVEMLMTCTVVKFVENDGLPTKICTNCITEINKAFSFAKRCETTDKILRKCVIKLETEEAINSSQPQKVEPTIRTNEIIKTEILGDYECLEEVKLKEDVKMEFEENMLEVEAERKIKIECNETYDDPLDGSNEKDDELHDESYSHNSGVRNRWCTNSEIEKKSSAADDGCRFKYTTTNFEINDDEGLEKSNNSGSGPKRRCTVAQMEKKKSKDGDSETYDDPVEEGDDEDQVKTYSEIHENEGNTKNEIGPHKNDSPSKFGNRINQRQTGIHSGTKSRVCEVCGKVFSHNSRLKIHMRTHTEEKPHICEVCNKGFRGNMYLKIHMRIHTGEKPYACEVCNKGFARNDYLKLHMRLHTGEKPFICKVCSKAYTESSTLQMHMKIHTGEKPYACENCSKDFSQKIHLKQHIMRIHTGEKPHICDVCSKAFSQFSHLQLHMRIHTGKKPYICEVCSSAFSQPSFLHIHMRMHTGEKPYTCEVCGKTFSRSAHHKRHMRIHTKV